MALAGCSSWPKGVTAVHKPQLIENDLLANWCHALSKIVNVFCRFRHTDNLSHLFDAIDVYTQGQDLPLSSYRLVAQYPRRVFTAGTSGTLLDVGLAQAKQETVLVETID